MDRVGMFVRTISNDRLSGRRGFRGKMIRVFRDRAMVHVDRVAPELGHSVIDVLQRDIVKKWRPIKGPLISRLQDPNLCCKIIVLVRHVGKTRT